MSKQSYLILLRISTHARFIMYYTEYNILPLRFYLYPKIKFFLMNQAFPNEKDKVLPFYPYTVSIFFFTICNLLRCVRF
ncbi:hypothetical protein BD408DRAFT_426210 [Parasitella parasitica]|nr:hypothetical protein BD408DRAFT_426210 [Parasitella parasitica]